MVCHRRPYLRVRKDSGDLASSNLGKQIAKTGSVLTNTSFTSTNEISTDESKIKSRTKSDICKFRC
jgi:hypothetical protein